MKIINLFMFFTLIISCHSQTEMENITISYKAITRGSSISIIASSNQIIYKSSEKELTIQPSAPFWKELTDLIKEINMEEIESFIPPSEDRIADAALHATISFNLGNNTYTSRTFDHGNPPKELKPIIYKLFKSIDLE